ncbi:radical SAM protein [Desulfovibrio sulfodismutans]|uniref:Radical SAM protein n=1 Tax=Desulfolutivibrio sulfodismutans TaxID=63561 RepID=A0A7K3NH07_9BACT|nr:radical SAM protein [Desulfolutivibrio sulfodismutans]NDY55458.1 radical SAM protein [Desulfolutivibrio sulfodismutans]QLA12848.1 radical SAM protein [Desulfolutivibrio sulfodismutans DSM 3696]
MNRITLLAPTPPDLSAFGVRSLSASLRAAGVSARIVFLPGAIGRLRPDGGFAYAYPARELAAVRELCEGSTFVGVSAMTPFFDRAAQLSQTVRQLGIPVVWGGVHATLRPAEALLHADFVCVGEGEKALAALAWLPLPAGEGAVLPPGIHCRSGTASAPSPDFAPAPLTADLDSLPPFDFSCEQHYLIAPGKAARVLDAPLMERLLPLVPGPKGTLRRVYRTMADRGCPHNCAYCNVPTVKALHAADPVPFFRHRSPEHVIAELVAALGRFPSVAAVQFFDDTFFAKPLSWFEEFAVLYARRVGLPFYCQASPATLDAGKLDLLLDAGLCFVEMGVQTGSERIRRIFRRKESVARIESCGRMIASRRARLLPPVYHVIIDSPWETHDDLMDTVRLLANLPKPYGLAISSLVFFPGTALHARAVAEGLLQDETAQVYRRPFHVPPHRTYPGFLLYLLTFQNLPEPVMRLLLRPGLAAWFGRAKPVWFYRLGYVAGEAFRLACKGVRAMLQGDWRRVGAWLAARLGGEPGSRGRMGE